MRVFPLKDYSLPPVNRGGRTNVNFCYFVITDTILELFLFPSKNSQTWTKLFRNI